MTKRAALWLGALAIVGFAFLAAVNASHTYVGYTGVSEQCGGFGSLNDWFSERSGCEELLPGRLAVLLIGGGIAIVPIYFAEKERPARSRIGPASMLVPVENTYADHVIEFLPNGWAVCLHKTCEFESRDEEEARRHDTSGGEMPAAEELSSPSGPAPGYKACPDCAEDVRAAARKCRFCGYTFENASVSA